MLLERLRLTPEEIARGTGWDLKPEGACRDGMCVPLPDVAVAPGGTLDVRAFAERMDMPIASDERHGLYALGPRAGGKVLASARVPHIVLDDFAGSPFDFASLPGRKVLLIAWASW
jgi:hypothetical protein